jgi:hypothetical protein
LNPKAYIKYSQKFAINITNNISPTYSQNIKHNLDIMAYQSCGKEYKEYEKI